MVLVERQLHRSLQPRGDLALSPCDSADFSGASPRAHLHGLLLAGPRLGIPFQLLKSPAEEAGKLGIRISRSGTRIANVL